MRSLTESFLERKRNRKSSSPYCSCGLNLLLRCRICQTCILHRFKVTVYFQGCLAYKRCSVSSLIKLQIPNTVYQIKAYRTGYQTISTILKRNELSSFSRLLNASARITFRMLHVRAKFVFRLFNASLFFRARSAKKTCLRFAIYNFSEKLLNNFEMGSLKKSFERKIRRHFFVVDVLIYPLPKFGDNRTNS